MNRYKIDYGWSVADFWCSQSPELVIKEFYKCANACFGIRKSITIDPVILESHPHAELPPVYREKGITHLLMHSGDEIAFDATYRQDGNDYWKVKNEHDDWCSCPNRGEYNTGCEVHKWYIRERQDEN